ncbi:MAG TPA: Crp/Fnr family transcriptional regulator [Solirubrobacteraceae bacterium]|nr:Crp/Fnr family transcriptional regulator [Solirubrobacteraceae bacterium]
MAWTSDERMALLRAVPIFGELGDGELAQIAEASVPRAFAAEETVFREGDEGDTCYVLRLGRVRALREHPDGRSITLATFGPGELFGELSLLDRGRRSATVEAVEDAEAVAIMGRDMRRLLRAEPDIALGMLASLGRRLRATNERLARQSFQTVPSRVASALRQLIAQAAGSGAPVPAAACGGSCEQEPVRLAVTQAQIAQLAGCARETASRFLAQLVRDGVIEQGRGRLTVLDPERLERYVF